MNTAKYNWARAIKAEIHRHSDEEIKRANQIIECPNCGIGWPDMDSLCDECWKEYLGTHIGGRGNE